MTHFCPLRVHLTPPLATVTGLSPSLSAMASEMMIGKSPVCARSSSVVNQQFGVRNFRCAASGSWAENSSTLSALNDRDWPAPASKSSSSLGLSRSFSGHCWTPTYILRGATVYFSPYLVCSANNSGSVMGRNLSFFTRNPV